MVLQAIGIRKSFQSGSKELRVLKGIDLEIKPGTLTAIVGASGVGKSTLLHILGGLDTPNQGEIYLDTTNIFTLGDTGLSSFRNRTIGFVFQFHHLLAEFNALENVMLPLLIARQDKSKSQEKAYHLLEEGGVKERFQHRPAELSGGEQQRLALARALANDPRVIIADEPTGNLDRKSSQELVELLMQLKQEKGLTIVLATHNLEIARRADFVYELAEGQVSQKRPEELN